ncbi:hypothetical protein CHRY9393_02835 [Chryseobacterium fistulae]|uniref:Uncharacterized protein n=1 Tax=Chryseobacterium fistulae TaxID=2675058 RepID=A0A6N4XWK2_9FLAO|nr:hypothetical protein CHRY9393_02835 [Chryseobacterium fistulae]
MLKLTKYNRLNVKYLNVLCFSIELDIKRMMILETLTKTICFLFTFRERGVNRFYNVNHFREE